MSATRGVKEIPEDAPLRAQVGAVGGQAVDHHALGFQRLYELFDPVEMHIYLDFLRRIVFQP